ncbi:MAG: DUF4198 domain-containing protein [Bryobacterales bacterium]|nr:DUF4198 domain-containing protein [Bryobacterales bacterium]
MRLRSSFLLTLALLLAATLAWGHFNWLIRTHYSASGDTAYLEIGHGHGFPVSEEASSLANLKAYLVAANGSRQPVQIANGPKSLKLEVKLPSKDLARVYYVRDRGVRSQTAAGWKEGGRDAHPGAKTVRKSLDYGISWVGFNGTTYNAKPLGLDLELNYESGLRGRMVRVWRKGKPARDIDVLAVAAGDREIKLGKTDRDGYVKVTEAVPERGPVLFSTALTEKGAKGANYDQESVSCTLALPAE